MTLSTTADGRVRCREMDAPPLCLSARRPSERLAWRPGQRPIIRAAIRIHYLVLTGRRRRGLSCSPNLKCLKLLSCKLTPLQIVVGMIPSSRGPDLAVAACLRTVTRCLLWQIGWCKTHCRVVCSLGRCSKTGTFKDLVLGFGLCQEQCISTQVSLLATVIQVSTNSNDKGVDTNNRGQNSTGKIERSDRMDCLVCSANHDLPHPGKSPADDDPS